MHDKNRDQVPGNGESRLIADRKISFRGRQIQAKARPASSSQSVHADPAEAPQADQSQPASLD